MNDGPVERTCLESLFLSFDFRRLSNNLPSNKRILALKFTVS